MLKNIIYIAAITFAMFVSTSAFSGAGHDHGHSHDNSAPLTSEQVITKASQELATLIDEAFLVDGKALDASWNDTTEKKIHKKTIRHYIIAFTNSKQNRTLYILLNYQGAYIDANFSGEFDGI